jgi:CubicO group peptidase (beta-lactamase class C family)
MTLTAERLAAVKAVFEKNFAEREELGASVSIWQHGQEILSLADGFCEKEKSRPWTVDTIVPVWSATKGLASACAIIALEEAGRSIDDPVAALWPELGQGITFKHVLTHSAGLCALDEAVEIFDYDRVIEALERQTPHWTPGTKHGYHSRTIGFLLDEIVRRASGAASLGEYWQEKFARPWGLDFYIGLPAGENDRVARLYPGRMRGAGEEETDFYRAFGDETSLTRRTFNSPRGLAALSGMNDPTARATGWPAMGGIGSAQALAKFYSRWSRDYPAIADGMDLVFRLRTAFGLGFMKDPTDPDTGKKWRHHFGPSQSAYGHPGAGGSHAFYDPENSIAFAYVMNQMAYGVLPNEKSLEMVAAMYG